MPRPKRIATEDLPPGRVFGYGRASHVDNSFGESIPGQRARCEQYFDQTLKQQGYTWGGWFADVVTSAYKTPLSRRDVGGPMLKLLKPGDVLLVDKMDRIFRSIQDWSTILSYLKEHQIQIVFAAYPHLNQDTAAGWLNVTMLAVFAEFDSRLKSERIREGVARARALGKVGGKKFDYPGIRKFRRAGISHQGKPLWDPVWCETSRSLMNRIVILRDDGQMDWVEIAKLISVDIREAVGAKRRMKNRHGSPIFGKMPRPFRALDARKWYRFEKTYRHYGIVLPEQFKPTSKHKPLDLETAEKLRDLPIPGRIMPGEADVVFTEEGQYEEETEDAYLQVS